MKGGSVIYTVDEVASLLGLSKRTIQRNIASLAEDVRSSALTDGEQKRNYLITDFGLKWLAEKHNISLDPVTDNAEIETEQEQAEVQKDDTVVLALLEQLRQKDLQLAEKDKQIALLMEQAKNYQVLLQGQQMLSLPAPKRSIFARLFGRKDFTENE